MALELGDHVWYWNGLTSTNMNIPRAAWFPGSNPGDPNDYLGNGKDIYNYVIHSDGIARGRPHMRNLEGSFAWLNNNPGNITGVPGGPDFGQYPGKFNWHNFLIFPTWEAGYDAIAQLLRTQSYVNLSLTDAFRRYAPAGDGGNDPDLYAQQVATAAGIPTSTPIGDLDDDQMLLVQNKITEIEGPIAGVMLDYGDPEVPAEISAELL